MSNDVRKALAGEREEFEAAWIRDTRKTGILGRDANGEYTHALIRGAWWGWLNRARAALSEVAHPASPPVEAVVPAAWQPIETAPQDGYVLVYEDEAMRALLRIAGVWHKPGYPAIIYPPFGDVLVGDDAKRVLPPGCRLEVCDGCCENPTHWMPLPAPPTSGDAIPSIQCGLSPHGSDSPATLRDIEE